MLRRLARRSRARTWLVGLVLGLDIVTVAGQAVPSYSRATTPATMGRFDNIVAIVDFNGDRQQDLLVGGNLSLSNTCVVATDRPLPPPLRVMISNGNGTFRDGTAEFVQRDAGSFFNPMWPRGVVADFNSDDRPDIAVFSEGTECGTYPTHTYVGYPGILLLSGPDGKWHSSGALADAVTRFHAERLPQYRGPNLKVLHASAGDVNGDRHVDIWVESCGGENVCSHFLMNNGDGTFSVDINRAPSEVLHNPRPEFWRHYGNALVDLNGDDRLDLILGQIKDTDPTHVNEASLVVFNDGIGRFLPPNRVLLPAPDFAGGDTSVVGLTALDLDGDQRKDLILTHSRGATHNGTGRYVQILMNHGGGRFVDDTHVRMGDQSAAMKTRSDIYAQDLKNRVEAVFLRDVNGDGTLDLVMNANCPISWEAPLAYLNDGRGRFTVMDPDLFTGRERFFGENSVPLDLNGDQVVDFVHTDRVPGPDGRFGNDDDVTQLIALVGRLAR